MKRRGFFGFAAGAAVAGPGMAKEAMNELTKLSLSGAAEGAGFASLAGQTTKGLRAYDVASGMMGFPTDPTVYATDMVSKLIGITAAQRARLKAQQHVSQLDPDIASYRSLSLTAKIDMQRERIVNAVLTERKTWWQRLAEGITPDDPDQLNIW
jgi:hypothetical protein